MRQAAIPHDSSPAEEWLLDNSHVVENQLREIEEDLPAGYLRKLSRLAAGPMAGYPRVYALCLDYLRHTDARIERHTLVPYVLAYQAVAPLTIGELWAVPIMLRIGLVLSVGGIAASEVSSTDRTRADGLAREMLSHTCDGASLPPELVRASEHSISAPFLVQLIRRLREHESLAVTDWIAAQAAKLGMIPEDLTRQQHLRQAADQVSVGNAITSMRAIGALDWNAFFERTSLVEEILGTDPGQAYASTDARTRDRYRHAVEDLARRSDCDELSVARAAVALAAEGAKQSPDDPGPRHVGYYLIDDGRGALEKIIAYRQSLRRRARSWLLRHPTEMYLGALFTLTALVVVAALAALDSAGMRSAALAGVALLLLLPAMEVVLTLINGAVTGILPPRILAKLDFHAGIPAEHATLVVVPSMLDSLQGIRKLLEDLEIRSLANSDAHLSFALVTDFTDHDAEERDADASLLAAASDGIAALNRRRGSGLPDRYFLLHRKRLYNASQGCWMGWERKRGKLDELNRLLRGAKDTSFSVVTGTSEQLERTRYVITLDADTQLPREVARKLVAAIAHPLNRPQFDATRTRVVRGYGIIQPRIGIMPMSSRRSRFARIVAGPTGLDPYTTSVSDVYQDLFGEGSYVGKGIYDVDAFEVALRGRVPDDSLLSHDLFEGVHARTALATDIEVLDDLPSTYAAFVGRQHRWVRGDWQLLPWLRHIATCRGDSHVPCALPVLARWRFADNLRRSLVAPALIVLLSVGWFSTPLLAAAATLGLFAVVAAPLCGWLAIVLVRGRSERSPSRLSTLRGDLPANILRAGVGLVFLLDQSLSMIDAIVRTLYRLLVSRRHLLEWMTMSESACRSAGRSSRRRLAATSALAVALIAALGWVNPTSLPWAGPVLLLWALAPLIAGWLGLPLAARDLAHPLTAEEKRMFRRLALQTWSFFETFATAKENWLPPDNFQEQPRPVVAHRTSPTNIGLYLMSTVAARDFGFVTLDAVCGRLARTLATLDQLEKREGHILNWYDTTTLEPLEPQYVSTVDSGNLAGYLWTLRQACLEFCERPIVDESAIRAAVDALGLFESDERARGVARAGEAQRIALANRLVVAPVGMAELPSAASTLEELLEQVGSVYRTEASAVRAASELAWLGRVQSGLTGAAEELRTLAPWSHALATPPDALLDESLAGAWRPLVGLLAAARSPREIAAIAPEALATIEALQLQLTAGAGPSSAPVATYLASLHSDLQASKRACESLIASLTALGERAAAIADAMNFHFLYDDERALFSIGYNVSSSRRDNSYYDLLASESRLASLVAIAKGDVPVEHWFHLGRPLTELSAGRVLLSWNGSMFEYLMPLLVMRSPDSTLLNETCGAVVERQREYGQQRDVPWGVSESAYNTMDLSMTYQYRAFGVPGLGLKAGLANDLVVAPYATLLAAQVRPDLAAPNLRALDHARASGPFGFYDSIDFTPSHVPPGKRGVVVKAFMAHHQGMSLVALDNVLNGAPMQRRFHADVRVRASELLLEERVPTGAPLLQLRARPGPVMNGPDPDVDAVEHVGLGVEPLRLHVLGQGDLSTVVSASGTGLTTWRGVDVYRSREDHVDPSGLFVYLRDVESGEVWSVGHEPIRRAPQSYDAAFSADRVEIRRRDGDLETLTEVVVSPEHPAEVRRVTITNHGKAARQLELTTYTEVVLATRDSDVAHRAFSSLFIRTEAVPERGAVLAHRRAHLAEETDAFLVQVLAPEDGQWHGGELETSRARFVGRGRTVRDPQALDRFEPLSGTTGDVLDPIVALRRRVRIKPGKRARISLTTALASSREAALELVEVFSSLPSIERTFELGRADARLELRHLGVNAAQAERMQKLLSLLLVPRPALRAVPQAGGVHGRSQDALWAQGISGDLPILVLRVDDAGFAPLASELLLAHEFWRLNGIACDLVLLNDEPGGYEQPLQNLSLALVEASAAHGHQNQRGGVHVRRSEQLSPEDRSLLLGAARVVLDASGGSLGRQLRRAWSSARESSGSDAGPRRSKERRGRHVAEPVSVPGPPLSFSNGTGGFSADGREYVMSVGLRSRPPAPWSNVIANPHFGCLVSESGAGFTWASNSQSHRITPWSNDAVSDPICEVIHLRDTETGECWSATPAPAGGDATYLVKHGQGYSTFAHTRAGLEHTLTVFVSAEDPVKVSRLRLVNHGRRGRKLSIFGYVEWVLGGARDRSRLTVITENDALTGTIFAQNSSALFTERRAFFGSTPRSVGSTADREEFFGADGSRDHPQALDGGGLSGRAGGGLDPCAALEVALELEAGQVAEVTFVLGEGCDATHARELARAYTDGARIDAELARAVATWDRILGAVTVKTPDQALDLMLNRWLLYQVVSARLWARSGFYQSGGAYGFRDQLQDVLALVHSQPALAREHILRAAARQFVQGDVQHWWHPQSGEGVRTHCSDDMLWLPYATAHYVRTTGDASILDVAVPFLAARRLEPGERDHFSAPAITADKQTLYEHCVRAIDEGVTSGALGLPLMRAGDWNDGMNHVGREGRGESVWLAWFIIRTLRDFMPVALARGDEKAAAKYAGEITRITDAVERNAWDGLWYQRASFDDGTPLGSKVNPSCRIDAIAQSWAVIAGTGDVDRAAIAVRESDRLLFRESDGMMLLFSPPFDGGAPDPGYIAAYPPGVRENGGQYTHGVLWSVLATALLGDGERAMAMLSALNPVNHSASPEAAARYVVEPYVVAADVYALEGAVGRGGWTWYTGSASWMYRIALEHLLGVQLRDGKLTFVPCVPRSWTRYEVVYTCAAGRYQIVVENPQGLSTGLCRIELDGELLPDGAIALDGEFREHQVRVLLLPRS
jgi:cyclic beta-1,2-glucan synthetase